MRVGRVLITLAAVTGAGLLASKLSGCGNLPEDPNWNNYVDSGTTDASGLDGGNDGYVPNDSGTDAQVTPDAEVPCTTSPYIQENLIQAQWIQNKIKIEGEECSLPVCEATYYIGQDASDGSGVKIQAPFFSSYTDGNCELQTYTFTGAFNHTVNEYELPEDGNGQPITGFSPIVMCMVTTQQITQNMQDPDCQDVDCEDPAKVNKCLNMAAFWCQDTEGFNNAIQALGGHCKQVPVQGL